MRPTLLGGLQGSFEGPGGPVRIQRGQGASWEGRVGSQGGSGGPGGGFRDILLLFRGCVNCVSIVK